MASEWDLFICHASEDKDSFVRPLAIELGGLGLNVWFDEFSLRVGDSLRGSIDRGLAGSRYGVVVFSSSFFLKNWPQAELSGLFSLEMGDVTPRILPVWHKITQAEMNERSPLLADRLALNSGAGVEHTAKAIFQVVKPGESTINSTHRAATRAAQRLQQEFEGEHPGYTIRVTGGSATNAAQASPALLASSLAKDFRTDILVRDPAALKADPPKVSLKLTPGARAKIQEMLRTGRPQTILPGEFRDFRTNIPFPAGAIPEVQTGQLLKLIPCVPVSSVPVALLLGALPDQIRYPIMQLAQVRIGTAEIELSVSHESVPFVLRITIPFGSTSEGNVNFEEQFEGHDFRQIQKYLRGLDLLRQSGELAVVALATQQPLLQSQITNIGPEEGPIKRLVDDLVSLEDLYGVQVAWPKNFPDDDLKTLELLLCAKRAVPFEGTFHFSVQQIKTGSVEKDAAVLQILERGQNYFLAIADGHFEVFGSVVYRGQIRIEMRDSAIARAVELKAEFLRSAPGDTLLIDVESRGPVSIALTEDQVGS